MAKPLPTAKLEAIERIVRAHPDGVSAAEIAAALPDNPSIRTLQSQLSRLVRDGRLVVRGAGKRTRYRSAGEQDATATITSGGAEMALPLSPAALDIRTLVQRPEAARKPVGYDRQFLERYRPNQHFYLSAEERSRLAAIAKRPADSVQPAGTYARTILNRLLIDLSWNSSRLEGNTYSLLDTKRLIAFGQQAEGRDQAEAQMILNHKDAIEFLAENADDIGFNRYTVLNLHGILANNLLADPSAAGRLRYIGVGIVGSVYHPTCPRRPSKHRRLRWRVRLVPSPRVSSSWRMTGQTRTRT